MTEITGFIQPTRRSGSLGAHSVDHFSLVVPDLAVAQRFYTAFGLDVREEGNSLGLYTTESSHCWGSIAEGPSKKLNYISFGVFDDDMERLRRRLQEHGVMQLDPPKGFETNGLWFRDPDQNLLEFRVARKSSPDQKSLVSNVSALPGQQGSFGRSRAPLVRPRRFAHILIFASDISRAIKFYEAVVGLRLSDRSGEGVAFLHGIHGSDHHMVALAKSAGPGLHHLSWDVGSINEVGLGAMQMADKGFSAGWGLGRHVLGSNYFHYIRDPWGSWCEYSSDIDYVPADCDWASADHAPEDAFYVWGPTPPADFTVNHEITD